MFGGFYHGKRVLVTGHTGFKGAWLSLWLRVLGAEIHGFALDPPTVPSLHGITGVHAFPDPAADGRGDVGDLDAVQTALERVRPEVIFHLAAQPLVRLSYAEPLETFRANTLGTAHVLEAIRRHGRPCVAVIVTTDKCYENREWEFAYRENDPLGGHDVYSMSKAAAELAAASWRRSFFQVKGSPDIRLATARAGNVIGGGDYALDRIVPDCVRALADGEPIPVRNPRATRPWQHVLECLGGYLWLGARLGTAPTGDARFQTAVNFGPGPGANRPVGELVETLLRAWPGGRWEHAGKSHAALATAPHEAGRLNLAIDRAGALLDWLPVWGFEEAVNHTVDWYQRRHAAGADDAEMLRLCRAQIETYTLAAAARRLAWATAPATPAPAVV